MGAQVDSRIPRVVAFVPLKLKSQRAPGKNIRLLGDKPLFHWILGSLLGSKSLDEIYVFASADWSADSRGRFDDSRVKFLERPKALDSPHVSGSDIYQAFASQVHSDLYLLAHATSPFLTSGTVDACISAVVGGGFDSALTVSRHQTFARNSKGEPINFSAEQMPPTQNLDPIFSDTSGLYLFDAECAASGRRTGKRPFMNEVRFPEALDIDDEEDFLLAEMVAKHLEAFVGPHTDSTDR